MKTVKLYQQDVYQRAFDARVLRVLEDGEGDLLILDQTAFFPEGGGQPCDRGTLDRFPVDKVWEQGGLILHRLPGGSGLRAGDQVSGVLDWERRFLHMQRHCGEHILSGIFLPALRRGQSGISHGRGLYDHRHQSGGGALLHRADA